ncbi:MAG: hypothetical protein IPM34_08500 [Saprospiraceae bacterium]|nr:hypothetical protein [Saprospiraceae bacterium]
MKLYFLYLLPMLFIVALHPLSSQVYPSTENFEERTKKQVLELTERLYLSEEQAQLLQDILLNHGKIIQEKRSQFKDQPRDSIRAAFQTLELAKNAEIKNILTEKQFTSYLEYAEEQRLKRRERFRQ